MKAATTAFGRNDNPTTLARLAEHANRFPAGRHAAGREALWIQLLMREGRAPAARAKLAAFRVAFPRSKMMIKSLEALVDVSAPR